MNLNPRYISSNTLLLKSINNYVNGALLSSTSLSDSANASTNANLEIGFGDYSLEN